MHKLALILGLLALVASGCSSDALGVAGCKKDADCPDGYVCENDRCVLECEIDIDCDDANVCTDEICDLQKGCVYSFNTGPCDDDNQCTDGDTCDGAASCVSGTPVFDGAECDRDNLSETRDICLDVECVPSICGDDFVDDGFEPPEECDDGNMTNGDGCENDCTIVPPDLVITFPERGDTLTGSTNIVVTGTAGDDALGLQYLTINGDNVTVAGDGSFTYPMDAVHGLNFVEAIAVNNGGKRTRRTVGYYHSAAYAPYADPEADSDKLDDALVMRISQEAIDDYDHPCTYDASGYECTEIDDIATLGEIVLNNLDLSATIGAVPIYQDVTNFLDQTYPVALDDLIISGLSVAGDVVVTGDVIFTVSVTDLDVNSLALELKTRNDGVDADVEIDEHLGDPGFAMTILTTVEIPITAAFDPYTLSVAYEDYELLSAICFVLQDLGGYDLGIICPVGDPLEVDAIASLTQVPPPSVWSTMSIGSMHMVSTFTVTTAPGGGVEVDLLGGIVSFNNSEIDIQPIADMSVNLGTINILGAEVDLGYVDVGDVAQNLNGVLSGILSAFTNDLQPLLEVALAVALFHPDDPLTVGNILKAAIEQVAPNGPVPLEAFGDQTVAPVVEIGSDIMSIELTEATSSLVTGGMTPGLDVLFSSTKVVERDPLGSLLSPGCYDPEPPLVFAETSALEMAQHVDTINQALHAVWWNGGFDFVFADEHLDPLSNLAGEAFDFDFTYYTAPIINRCDHDLFLETADIHIAGSFGAGTAYTPFEAFVNVSLPMELAVGDQALRLIGAQAGTPFIAVEVVSDHDPEWAAELETLLVTALTEDILVPYASHVIDSMPTFVIDLSALSVDAGAAVLQFLPESTGTLGGYEILTGAAGQ